MEISVIVTVASGVRLKYKMGVSLSTLLDRFVCVFITDVTRSLHELSSCSVAMAASDKEFPSAILHYHNPGHYGVLIGCVKIWCVDILILVEYSGRCST